MAIEYFSKLYRDPQSSNICDKLEIIKHYPTFFYSIDCEFIRGPILLGEVLETLKWFSKDTSMGPDGWTMELYLHFFDLIGMDLVQAIEE